MVVDLGRRQVPAGAISPNSWWFSDTGYIVRYAVTGALVLLVVVWVIGGTMHAKSRLAKGKAPLAYHSWLVRKAHRGGQRPSFPSYSTPARHATPQDRMEHSLSSWSRTQPEAPPNYYHDVPPAYQPAGSKAEPGQTIRVAPLGDPAAGAGPATRAPTYTEMV